ncbi:MAG: DUF2306 domain-containing protein [Vicinamibacteria bacterium]|jgi:hypothetical protein|nr:DUF2306 domain-containing protein [Vicinamibacteria bacterium]MBP9945000.1 DUF2306 domain-containing protein [Vicinamibacteria bacterium]
MTAIDYLMKIHIAAGITALATFLVPMVTAKGGVAHRRVGWIFVAAMAGLFFTGAPASIYRLATETRPGVRASASFLLFVTLLSGASTWKGIRVLRFKGAGRNVHAMDISVAVLLGLGSVFMLYQGVMLKSALLLFFAALGLAGSVSDLRYWLNPAKPKMHWFFEHMGGMVGSSIAALTAFSAIGARSLGFGSFGLIAWIAPTVVFVPISILMTRHYRRKFKLDVPKPLAQSAPALSSPQQAA